MVMNHSKATGTDKLLLVGIANHDGDGGAWPSIATLMRYGNVSERSVQYALKRLVEMGELKVHLQRGGTADTPEHQRTNRYEILVRCPEGCDRSFQHRGATDCTPPPAVDCTPPVQPTAPEPIHEPIHENSLPPLPEIAVVETPRRRASIPARWRPDPSTFEALAEEFPDVDVTASRLSFLAYYRAHSERKSTDWNLEFAAWVGRDNQRIVTRRRDEERGGTDDLGIPHAQRRTRQEQEPVPEGYSYDETMQFLRERGIIE